MFTRPFSLTALLLLSLLAGCSSARTEHFDIDLHNATSGPLTLSLAKDGPPYEPAWATPEDVAIETPREREKWAGVPSGISAGRVPPGKTAFVRGLTGHFEPHTRAFLRVYAGEVGISQMLSRQPGSPDRLDIPLLPGRNDITITLEGTSLKAQAEVTTPSP